MIHFAWIETNIAGKIERQIVALHFDGIGQEAVGFVALKATNTRSAGICKLFVVEKFRQQGLGTRLVRECEKIATSCLCESINGYIEADNADVIPFYLSCDWFVSCQYEDGSFAVCKRLPYS